MKKGELCIWGDSIVYGSNDDEKGGWVNRLKLFVDNKIGDDISVCNLGVSGDDTNKLIARFKSECSKREPKVIIFAIGINDTQYIKEESTPKVSLEKFTDNVIKLINIAKEYTSKIGIIGLTRVDESRTQPFRIIINYSNSNIIKYDLALRKIARVNSIKYLRLFNTLETTDLDDGLHPNSTGHEKIYNKTKKLILEIHKRIEK